MNIVKTVGLSLLLLGLTACGSHDSAEEHVAKAREFISGADYKSAIIELKNALQLDNQLAEARYLLGTTYLESGDTPSAEKELERALQLGWPTDQVRPVLARTLLAQGELARVREISTQGLPPQSMATVLAMKAQAALGQGDTWEAEELIDKALASSPDSVEALLARARLLASSQDFAGATAVLDQIISHNPDQSRAWSLRGDILAQRQDFEGALAAYQQAINIRKRNYGDLLKRGLLLLQLGNYEAAQADASALLKLAPRHPGPNYLQGLLYFQAGKYGDAITNLSLTEPVFAQYPSAEFFLASAHMVQGNLDQAAVLAESYHRRVPDSIRGRKLLATIRLQQGNYSAVQALLQPVLLANADDIDALNLTANALLRDGKTNEGIELLSRVATLQPDSSVAQVRLGAGLLLGGQEDSAAQPLEAALELNPEFQQADILLVLNHMRKRDFAAAIAAAESYQRRHPTSVTPHNLLGKVYQEAGQPDQAEASFKRALTLDKGDPAANHNLAQMALAAGDAAAARDYYQAVLTAHNDSVPTLIQLARLDARAGDEESLVAHLKLAIAADPTVIQPRLLLARYYLGKGKPEQVAPLFTSLDASKQQAPEVLQVLAMAQLSSKDANAAQFTLDQLLEKTPDSAPIRHLMALAAAGAGDDKRATQELRRALVLDENYLPSRIALAKIALVSRDEPELEQHLEKLVAQAPNNPDVLLLQAAAAQGQGDTAGARKFAEQAFAAAPTSATLISMATYQNASGDSEAAIGNYNKWLAEHPQDVNARMTFASTLQLDQRFAEASDQYADVLQAAPDNVIALNNQAWLYREQDPALALEYARRAANLAPKSAEVLDTLAVVELLNKNYPQAQRSIERALKEHPRQPSMLYHSAMIAAARGDSAGARKTLEQLLAETTKFPEIAEARALLAELDNQ